MVQCSHEILFKFPPFADALEQKIIRTAMDKIANNSCIRLIPRTNQPDYAEILNKKGQGFESLKCSFRMLFRSDVTQASVDFLARTL